VFVKLFDLSSIQIPGERVLKNNKPGVALAPAGNPSEATADRISMLLGSGEPQP